MSTSQETKRVLWYKIHKDGKTCDICYSYEIEGGFRKSKTITGYTYKGPEPSIKEIEYWLKTGNKYDISSKNLYIRIMYKIELFLDSLVDKIRSKRLK